MESREAIAACRLRQLGASHSPVLTLQSRAPEAVSRGPTQVTERTAVGRKLCVKHCRDQTRFQNQMCRESEVCLAHTLLEVISLQP